MKKKLLPFLSLLLLFLSATAQKNFTGKIVFGVKVLGENADQFAAFMPNTYEYQISGSNLRFKMNGGMTAALMGEFLVLGDEGTTYMIRHNEQTAYKMSSDLEEDENPFPPTIEKLDEIINILGYPCQKYKVTQVDSVGGEVVQYIWATDQLKITKPKNAMENGGNVFINGMSGFPLKMISNTMGMTMIMTAKEILPGKVDEMKVPKGYEIKDFDSSTFLGGMQ